MSLQSTMSSVEKQDNPYLRTVLTAPHDRSSALLHKRLKIFSLSTARTSQISRKAIKHDSNTGSLPTVQKRTILELPVELIRLICDFSTLASRACLALTCHQLLHYIGTRTFTDLDYNNTRLEKAAFLQKLQKDRPDPRLWLCYACLRFHSVAHRYEPSNFRTVPGKDGIGFPSCKSIYAKALDEIDARLKVPKSEWTAQVRWMEDDITSPVQMDVHISCLADATDLMMRRRYLLDSYSAGTGFEAFGDLPVSARLLHTLGVSNLEICPHICFARSWWRGDGSILSALKDLEEREHLDRSQIPIFQCAECRLDVGVEYQADNVKVLVSVWQHIGRLAYPSDQGHESEGRRGSHQYQLEPVERKQSKLLPLLTNSLSKSRTSSLLRLPKVPKSWTMTLESLKKPTSEAAKVLPGSGPVPARLLLNLGEMKRRWESLEQLAFAEDRERSMA